AVRDHRTLDRRTLQRDVALPLPGDGQHPPDRGAACEKLRPGRHPRRLPHVRRPGGGRRRRLRPPAPRRRRLQHPPRPRPRPGQGRPAARGRGRALRPRHRLLPRAGRLDAPLLARGRADGHDRHRRTQHPPGDRRRLQLQAAQDRPGQRRLLRRRRGQQRRLPRGAQPGGDLGPARDLRLREQHVRDRGRLRRGHPQHRRRRARPDLRHGRHRGRRQRRPLRLRGRRGRRRPRPGGTGADLD
ncbi:MAG: Acetoin dehydrogenase E1 component alpha-subunit, partial [uncultured Nocardioidaceae bacterium]